MTKPYIDELAEWLKKKDQKSRRRGRRDQAAVAFVAVQTDVEAALAAGYSQQTIWEHLHETGRIPYQYQTFLKHVRRFIKTEETPRKKIVKKAKSVDVKKLADSRKTKIKGFHFDSKPSEEELY